MVGDMSQISSYAHISEDPFIGETNGVVRCNRRTLRLISVPSSQRGVFTSCPTIPIAYTRCSRCDTTFPFSPFYRVRKNCVKKPETRCVCDNMRNQKDLSFLEFIFYLHVTRIYLILKCMYLIFLIFLVHDFTTANYIELDLRN